jgi:hypothetical protein
MHLNGGIIITRILIDMEVGYKMLKFIEFGLFLVGSLAFYKIFESPIKTFKQKAKNKGKIGEMMDENNLSFEDARDKLLAEKIAQIIKVEKNC